MNNDFIEKSKQVLAKIEFNDTTYEVARNVVLDEIERLNNIINRTTKYVESLSSSGRGCDIYEDIKQEILKELKGSDKE